MKVRSGGLESIMIVPGSLVLIMTLPAHFAGRGLVDDFDRCGTTVDHGH